MNSELTKEALEKRREYQREYYKNNKDKCREAMREYRKKKSKQQETEHKAPKRYVATGAVSKELQDYMVGSNGRKKSRRRTHIIWEDGFIKYIKKITPQGLNGYSSTVVLPIEMLEELRIGNGENVKIYKDGNKIIIEKG